MLRQSFFFNSPRTELSKRKKYVPSCLSGTLKTPLFHTICRTEDKQTSVLSGSDQAVKSHCSCNESIIAGKFGLKI